MPYEDARSKMGKKPGQGKKQNKDKNSHLLLTIVVQGDQPEAPETNATAADTEQQIPKTPGLKQTPQEKWICGATVAMAAFTGFLTVFAWWQLSIMSGQLEQMQSESRSWVGLDETIGFRGWGIETDPNGTVRTTCEIIPKNFGNYPATIMQVYAELMVTQDSNRVMARIEDFRQLPRNNATEHILFPGRDKFTNELRLVCSFPEKVLVASKDDTFELYIIGYILYRDQFRKYHRTRFAYRSEDTRSNGHTTWFHVLPRHDAGNNWRICYADAD